MQTTLSIIGANIRTSRREQNIKQDHLGKMTNMQKGAISKIENGKVPNLTVARLGSIAKALGKNIETLFCDVNVK